MGLYDNFPYTNKHELNLDWIVKKIGDIDQAVEQSEASATAAQASEEAAAASQSAASASQTAAANSADAAAASAQQISGSLAQIAENTEDISLMKNRCFVCIGDSFDSAYVNTKGNHYLEQVMINLGISTYYRFSMGSRGFATTESYPANFLELLQANIASITDTDTVTDVLVSGGANDIASSAAAIVNAITAFATYCRTTFPNLKRIHVTIPGYHRTSVTAIRAMMDTVRASYITGSSANNINYIDKVFNAAHNTELLVDNLHPTATGLDYIGDALTLGLLGQVSTQHQRIDITKDDITVLASGVTVSKLSLVEECDGDMCTITSQSLENFIITFPNTNNVRIDSLFQANKNIVLNDNYRLYIPCNFLVADANGTHSATGYLYKRFNVYGLTIPNHTFTNANSLFGVVLGTVNYPSERC